MELSGILVFTKELRKDINSSGTFPSQIKQYRAVQELDNLSQCRLSNELPQQIPNARSAKSHKPSRPEFIITQRPFLLKKWSREQQHLEV